MTILPFLLAKLHQVGLSDEELGGVDEKDAAVGRGPVHILVKISGKLVSNFTAQQTEMMEKSCKKRQKITPILPSFLLELAEFGRGLNRETDLAVGKLLELLKKLMNISLNKGLYIRQEYWDLYQIIEDKLASDDSISRVLVVGSPGIGKSVFGVFLLLLFMTEKKDVAYRHLDESVVYFFTWNSANRYQICETPVGEKVYIGLFDGNESGGALNFVRFPRAYVFASPHTKNYNEFVKEDCFRVYMNPWTRLECQGFANTINLEDHDKWLRKFNLVGGKLRILFSSSPEFDYDRLVKRVKGDIPNSISKLKDMVDYMENEVLGERIFLVCRAKDSPSNYFLTYSSLVVEAIVSCRYGTFSAKEIRSLLKIPEPSLQA